MVWVQIFFDTLQMRGHIIIGIQICIDYSTGLQYKLLEDTSKRLDSIEDSLTEQYKDALGADPYEAIMEMFNHQYSYNAALQVGSKLMNSSLFDFVR